MKHQAKQEEIIDFGAFDEDISLWNMVPSGRGSGQALLKTHVDAVLKGRAPLHSMLIHGSEGLRTTAGAFIRALGIDTYNQTDASLIQSVSDVHNFFCGEQYEGYILTNIERIAPLVRAHLCDILRKQRLRLFNYIEQSYDIFEIPGIVVMTTKNMKKMPEPILDAVQHSCEIEKYTSTEQLERVVIQRLKYANVIYENVNVIKDIVKFGNGILDNCIRFMTCCITVMQAEDRRILLSMDINRAARLNRMLVIQDNDADIPF